jgi:hypothetical protein
MGTQEFINQARAKGIPDSQIGSYLQNKGVSNVGTQPVKEEQKTSGGFLGLVAPALATLPQAIGLNIGARGMAKSAESISKNIQDNATRATELSKKIASSTDESEKNRLREQLKLINQTVQYQTGLLNEVVNPQALTEATKLKIGGGLAANIPGLSVEPGLAAKQIAGRSLKTAAMGAAPQLGLTGFGGLSGAGNALERGGGVKDVASEALMTALAFKGLGFVGGKVLGTQTAQRIVASPTGQVIGKGLELASKPFSAFMAKPATGEIGMVVDKVFSNAGKAMDAMVSPTFYGKQLGRGFTYLGEKTGVLKTPEQYRADWMEKSNKYWTDASNRYQETIRSQGEDPNAAKTLSEEYIIPKVKGNRMFTEEQADLLKAKGWTEQSKVDELIANDVRYKNLGELRSSVVKALQGKYKLTEQEKAIKYFDEELLAFIKQNGGQFSGKPITSIDNFESYLKQISETSAPTTLINDFKSYLWKLGYPKGIQAPSDVLKAGSSRVAGNTVKDIINGIYKDTNPEIADAIIKLNDHSGKLFEASRFLEFMNGKPAPMGRLGRNFMRLAGTIAGSSFGPVGSVAGAITADHLVTLMQNPEFVVGRVPKIMKLNPQAYQQAMELLKRMEIIRSTRLQLPKGTTIFAPEYKGGVSKLFSQEQAAQRLTELGTLNKLTPEQIIDKADGWKPGIKEKFDTALANKDAKIVKKLLPQVPEEYQKRFAEEIKAILGKSAPRIIKDVIDRIKEKPEGGFIRNPLAEEAKILRGTKGMTADDIMAKYPNIKLTKDIPATDIYGNKRVIPEGEKLTPYELRGNKILLQDGETYLVSKNQFQNIKGQSVGGEAKPFAPELKGLEETVKGKAESYSDWTTEQIKKKYEESFGFSSTGQTRERMINQLNLTGSKESSATKYSQYTLPGGENYKEILIKAPGYADELTLDQIAKDNYAKEFRELSVQQKTVVSDLWDKLNKPYKSAFKSSHWDEPNVISHLRLNERTYKGKKVSFLEELQSDWAREGREKGFLTDIQKETKKLLEERDAIVRRGEMKMGERGTTLSIKESDKLRYNEIEKQLEALSSEDYPVGKIPYNPNLKNWQELSIKRALKDAVDNDAEYFAWINGEQTSARYNLATYIDDVNWGIYKGVPNGSKWINVYPVGAKDKILIQIDRNGLVLSAPGQMNAVGKKLDEVLGKGLADKIMEKESGTLAGEGLKFGGEWANNLYDRQVGNIVKDLTGAKIETLDMGLPIEKSEQGNWFVRPQGGKPSYTITPENLPTAKGKVVQLEGETSNAGIDYIITDILGDGKFKAVQKQGTKNWRVKNNTAQLQNIYGDWVDMKGGETFDISQKTTTQQGIKLTPEIKAKIRGEALEIKTSGKQFE